MRTHAPPAAEDAVETGRALGVALLKPRANNRGQVADILGDQEIVLHEALDRRLAGMAVVAELVGDVGLVFECEPFFRAAGQEVQMAAHGP
jgi:hypothetical protein